MACSVGVAKLDHNLWVLRDGVSFVISPESDRKISYAIMFYNKLSIGPQNAPRSYQSAKLSTEYHISRSVVGLGIIKSF